MPGSSVVTLRSLLASAASAAVFLASFGVPEAVAESFPHASRSLRAPAASVASASRSLRAPAAPPVFTGQAFDSCSAPALTVMRGWWQASPYRAVGVYIGGTNRSCPQPELTRDWVRTVDLIGWRILPVYVGAQAPCITARGRSARIDPRSSLGEGRADGTDAARSAAALGLAPGSPVYLDVEGYRHGDTACTFAVLQYTTAWTAALRDRGYLAGFYSSDDSGITDLATVEAACRSHSVQHARPTHRAGSRESSALPDAIWYARWNSRPGTRDSGALGPGQWSGHRRVHQYSGGAQETYGGLSQWVDRDSVDAPVAVVAPR